VNLIKLFSTAI